MATVRLHKAAGHADPTDNEGVRQIIKGIARAHGKPQKQARPFTAEALPRSRQPPASGPSAAGARAWSRHSGRPREPGWTWPCWPPCGTGCC